MSQNHKKLITREEQKSEDTWAIEDLYPSDEDWAVDTRILEEQIQEFRAYEGHLGESSDKLSAALDAYARMNERLEKIYVYANQKFHEDTGSSKYQKISGEAQIISTRVGSASAYLEPEILLIPEERIQQYLSQNQNLSLYWRFLENILRHKEHTLSQEQEQLLAKADELAGVASNIYSMFNNADIKFGYITDEDGEQVELTQGRYITFLEKQDRSVREQAFKRLYEVYKSFQNTLAAAFDGNVRQTVFFARARKYESTLLSALDGGNIPVHVYDNLIKAVHQNLPSMYRYTELRKDILGLQELHMYDLHVPMVSDISMNIPFDEAKKMVLEGLRPLGEEYQRLLKEGFENRWIDVYENAGKRNGAYSWGAYGTHPYVLLNYQSNLNNVFTLAHEMGHAIHSYYSDKEQPYVYAGYRIFVAEVASTCNESLLIHYLLEKTEDKKEKAYLINYFLDQFKGTLFRQTMFAEFEKIMHHTVEQGGTLTAEVLSETYYNLNVKYYGKGVTADKEIAYEWARIPHFYTPFYVYQYATGFSAAIAISSKILSGEKGIVEKYKQFLSGGSSQDPIDLLKICGIDMTKPEPVQDALAVFEEYLCKLETMF